MTIKRQTALWTVRGGLAVGAAVLLAACGSSANNASGGAGGAGAEGGGQGFGGAQGGFGPGASGQVEAVSGSTAQVQNTQQQVAVTWTASTKFTQEVSASRSAVTVGSCVTVTAPRTSDTSSATPTTRPTEITAATVRITAATNGSCTAGGGRFGGQRPSGAPSGFGTQGAQPGGGQGRGGFRAFGAFGKVTAVSPSGFTVQSDFGGQSTTTTVTTTGSTTYTTTAAATASAVKEGVCLQATGNADSTGAVTATRITLSQPVSGACTSGFGPRG